MMVYLFVHNVDMFQLIERGTHFGRVVYQFLRGKIERCAQSAHTA